MKQTTDSIYLLLYDYGLWRRRLVLIIQLDITGIEQPQVTKTFNFDAVLPEVTTQDQVQYSLCSGGGGANGKLCVSMSQKRMNFEGKDVGC